MNDNTILIICLLVQKIHINIKNIWNWMYLPDIHADVKELKSGNWLFLFLLVDRMHKHPGMVTVSTRLVPCTYR